MRKRYNNSNLKFYIGDVRYQRGLAKTFQSVDHCFHTPALKQFLSCGFYPIEAQRTYVLKVAIANGQQRVICLSADKAGYHINAMGIFKAMIKKVMLAACEFGSMQYCDFKHALR